MNESPFGFDKPKDSPGFLLWQTTILWQRKIKQSVEEYGISHAQFVVMAISMWHHTQNLSAKQANIIAMSKLDKMTVSKALKQLANKGYLIRIEDKDDNRAKEIQLTETGKKLICTLVPIVETIDEEFFQPLGQQHATFQKLLSKIIITNS